MSGADQHQSPLSRPVALSSVIESHLEKILGSGVFNTADSLRRLLRFVVHETIAGRGDDLKEYSLGVSVLGKGSRSIPRPIRSCACRCGDFASTSRGTTRPKVETTRSIIDIPKGRYMPTFRAAAAAGAAPVRRSTTRR